MLGEAIFLPHSRVGACIFPHVRLRCAVVKQHCLPIWRRGCIIMASAEEKAKGSVLSMLGENIAALRKQNGMTQQTLAEALHVTRQTISKWEKNLSVPDADALVRLAEALDTTVQALLGAPVDAPEAPSEVAAALVRINDQLAEKNRRSRRLWRIVAWVVGLYVAFNVLLLALSATAAVEYSTIRETRTITQEENLPMQE